MTVLRYEVLISVSLPGLEDMVGEYLRLGYVPTGGVAVNHRKEYMQAVVLQEKEP